MNLLLSLLQTKLNSSGFDWIRVESINLSPSQKSLTADLKLAGETELIRFTGTYSVTPANAIRLESLTASRQWLTEVAGRSQRENDPVVSLNPARVSVEITGICFRNSKKSGLSQPELCLFSQQLP
jgi:hypothetical protein